MNDAQNELGCARGKLRRPHELLVLHALQREVAPLALLYTYSINVPLWLSFYQGPKEFFITDDVHPPTKMKVPALNDVITQGQLYFQATGFREPHTPWRGKIIPTKMREMWVAFD